MRAWDARWIAGDAAEVAIGLSMIVEGGLEDVDGSIDAGDYACAFESAVRTLVHLAVLRQVLEGAPDVPSGSMAQRVALLARANDQTLADLARLPLASQATKQEAQALAIQVRAEADRLRGELPFDIPLVRTPEGFWPSVRVARQLADLRRRLGLPPYSWERSWA